MSRPAPSGSAPVLSVAIIARDEADRLGEALASVAFADEIVVLDSGSSDGTPELARAAGARVLETDWPGHVAQKNRALAACSGAWILAIDADERVGAALREAVLAVVEDPGEHVAFSVPRLSTWGGAPLRHGTWYPDRRVRLFRRECARWEGVDPHDHVVVDGPVGALQVPLDHHPYRSLAEHLRTIEAYTARQAMGLLQQGVRARWWDVALRPPLHLMKAILLRVAFLDGPRGLVVAGLGALNVLLKWGRVYLAQAGVDRGWLGLEGRE